MRRIVRRRTLRTKRYICWAHRHIRR
jgi:hypothetical protein